MEDEGERLSAELFERWLAEGHDPEDVDALCAAHPEHEVALRQRVADWNSLQRGLADEVPGAGPVLVGSEGVTEGGAWERLIVQLRERGPGHSRYEHEGEIARGGMGVIHRVFDRDARRRLAMKVMLDGSAARRSDTPAEYEASLGRFLEEAQVTSQLDHPGVVPVHEIGVDADDRVYFTMKLVKGEDLRSIFDRVSDPKDSEWTVTRALNVMLRVCEAMAYAHSKGVIHRDLKPANVMVGKFGEAYVMDWGLARVHDREDTHDLRLQNELSAVRSARADVAQNTEDSPIVTMDGDVLGTPAYMPPEQAKGRVDDIGPAADVYAAGAMLYHLLSGRPPYSGWGERNAPLKILALVTQGPPEPLSALAPSQPAELQAIVEKAMSRSIEARYEDMNALANDLRAFVEQRVVAAYESGLWAEAKKWIRRNRALAGSVGFAAVLAVTAAVGFVWQRELAAQDLEEERDIARAVGDFQKRILTIDTWEDGSGVRAMDLVQRAAAEIGESLAGKPETEVAVREVLRDTFLSLGDDEAAEREAARVIELWASIGGEGDVRVFDAMRVRANILRSLGRYGESAEMARVADTELGRHLVEGDARCLEARAVYGFALLDSGRSLDAEQVFAGLVGIAPGFAEGIQGLGRARLATGDLAGAQRSLEDGLQRLSGKARLDVEGDLQSVLLHQGKYSESMAIAEHSVAEFESRLGADHPEVLSKRMGVAVGLVKADHHEEAEPLLRELCLAHERACGRGHPRTLSAYVNLAACLSNQKKYDEALGTETRVLEAYARIHGDTHPTVLTARSNHASTLLRSGRASEAIRLQESVVSARSETLGEAHYNTIRGQRQLAVFLQRDGQLVVAERAAREAVEAARLHLDPKNPVRVLTLGTLGSALESAGRRDEAIVFLREAFELSREVYGAGHSTTLTDHFSLANNLLWIEENQESAQLAEELAKVAYDLAGPNNAFVHKGLSLFAVASARLGQHGELLVVLNRAFDEWGLINARLLHEAVVAHIRLGQFDEAEKRLNRTRADGAVEDEEIDKRLGWVRKGRDAAANDSGRNDGE